MKNNKGVLLMELMTSMIIFFMVFLSLAVIWANSHRYLFNTYRQSVYKNSLTLAFRAVSQDMGRATMIDQVSDTVLSGAANVDKTGCFPISPGDAVSWFYYCLAPEESAGTGASLYYYTDTVSQTGPGCPPEGSASLWQGATGYMSGAPICGETQSGNEPLLLVSGLAPATTSVFSRLSGQKDRIRMNLTIYKSTTAAQKAILLSTTSEFKCGMNAQ